MNDDFSDALGKFQSEQDKKHNRVKDRPEGAFSNFFASESGFMLPYRNLWLPDTSKWSIVQPASLEVFGKLLAGKIDIDTLYWRDFEQLIACLLTLEGYEAWIGPGQKDGGTDIIAFKEMPASGRFMTIWQTKKLERKNKVDVDVISLLAEARNRLVLSQSSIEG